jgi:4'-phosphopantetheinyl transferase
MLDVYWLEQTAADVPAENDWLGSNEALHLETLRVPKRRSEWRLGRWTAKRALARCLDLPDDARALAEIEILPALSGAPEAFIISQRACASISLSHSCGRAICAVTRSRVALGCDLERIESRSDTFVADYFVAEEQALVARSPATDRAWLLALLWSGKESALKALHEGLRLDTRSVVVRPSDGTSTAGWHPLQVCLLDDRVFNGWWQQGENFVRTLVSAPPPDAPVAIDAACFA